VVSLTKIADVPSSLEGLFAPSSVAVYGASADPTKLGHTLLHNVLSGGGVDDVVAIHPSATDLQGVAAVTSLDRPVDLAVVSVPSAVVPKAVADACAGGAANVIVLSSGFGETGSGGKAIEDDLVALARSHGTRLVGPNCMGVLAAQPNGWLNGTYFWDLPLQRGHLSFLSQSGAFGGMFFSEVRRRGLGVSRFLSLGNAADVNVIDALEAVAADPETQVIGVFAEAIPDGRRFVDVARSITERIPIVALKSGKSAAGGRAAASHTGSLAGQHSIVQAALRRAGVIEAPNTDTFFDLLSAWSSPATVRPATGRRIAIVTISGGPSVLAADAAEAAGLSLPLPSDATVKVLRELAPSFAAAGNPIDLTPQCAPSAFVPAINAVYDDPAFDAVIVINCGLERPELAEGVVAGVQRSGKPTVGFVLDVPKVEATLRSAGIALFPGPERAAIALAAVLTAGHS
jgi:acyl-CoA synthetase (NDP forming)